MIKTTTTTEITCDVCGRQIALGDTWHQVRQDILTQVFDGTASLAGAGEAIATQLCDDDYQKRAATLTSVIPVLAAAAPL